MNTEANRAAPIEAPPVSPRAEAFAGTIIAAWRLLLSQDPAERALARGYLRAVHAGAIPHIGTFKTCVRDALLLLAVEGEPWSTARRRKIGRVTTMMVHAKLWPAQLDDEPMPDEFEDQCVMIARWMGRSLPGLNDDRRWREIRESQQARSLAAFFRHKFAAK